MLHLKPFFILSLCMFYLLELDVFCVCWVFCFVRLGISVVFWFFFPEGLATKYVYEDEICDIDIFVTPFRILHKKISKHVIMLSSHDLWLHESNSVSLNLKHTFLNQNLKHACFYDFGSGVCSDITGSMNVRITGRTTTCTVSFRRCCKGYLRIRTCDSQCKPAQVCL